MIVKVCDQCRKLLDSEPSAIVAIRSRGSVAFRKGESGTKVSGHFCSNACAAQYFEKWLEGVLPEPEVEPETAIIIQPPTPATASRPHAVSVLRQATPQEMAEQNAILASVLGGR